MFDLEYTSELMKLHLSRLPENEKLHTWAVRSSSIEGRGLFAVRDIHPGEVVFVDHPLIYGPRVKEDVPVGCIVCNCTSDSLITCDMGCGLNVCSEDCKKSNKHMKECKLISSWKTINESPKIDCELFARSIVPLRSLLLYGAEKDLLKDLVAHCSPEHGKEVRILKKHFEISEEEEVLMMQACRALDTNAYEMLMETRNGECVTLRGLYPISAFLNHSCSPNTRNSFDKQGKMYVVATCYIPEGSEIFTSYIKLLWATPMRRHHLMKTKHFLCDCVRCCDSSEFGTNLAALLCFDRKCKGMILPEDPLNFSSSWLCGKCGLKANPSQVGMLQSAIGGLLRSTSLDSPDNIYEFIQNHLLKFLPESNYIVLELKCQIVMLIGDFDKYKWNKVSALWLNRGEELCREVLDTLEGLRLGAAPLTAKLHLRLHEILLEKLRRSKADDLITDILMDLEKEVIYHMNTSYDVLQGNVLAPKDLDLRFALANKNVQSLIDYGVNDE